jgi:hypothetical protein
LLFFFARGRFSRPLSVPEITSSGDVGSAAEREYGRVVAMEPRFPDFMPIGNYLAMLDEGRSWNWEQFGVA